MSKLITTQDYLSAYERGEIGRYEAMRGIGVTARNFRRTDRTARRSLGDL